MKRLCMSVAFAAGLWLFPQASFADVAGRYDLDGEKMVQKELKQLKARGASAARLKMMARMYKTGLKRRQTWVILKKGGRYEKYIQNKGDKKPTLRAAGTWKQKGKTITLDAAIVKTKRKSSFNCTLEGKGALTCKGIKNPRLIVFYKKKAKK